MMSETPTSGIAPAGNTLEVFERLEGAIDGSLQTVIDDTESSAQAIIQHLRRLHDSAATVVTYLDGTSLQAGNFGKGVMESMAFLGDIGAFIERMPAKMEHDLANVRAIVEEIKLLIAMTADVQAISLQSHLLAINAGIEASRAGAAGGAFKVIADEMRKLASNSSVMAKTMNAGLSRASHIMENGLAATLADSANQLVDVSNAATSIHKLRDNFEDMTQYYKTRFAIVTKHNEDLAKDIAEALGQVQYQDVVRQSIERTRVATQERDVVIRELLSRTNGEVDFGSDLPRQLELVLDHYLAEDAKHRHSVRQTQDESAELKIELF